MDLDLRDLEVFIAVEREGSFGKAATALLVSQPAVSERIRHLERVVGRPVFERTARGANLTAAGNALLPHAQRCLTLAAESLDAARRAGGVPALVLAVHSTFAQRVVPISVGALSQLPRRISVRDAHSEQIPGLLLDGVADVGVALSGPAVRGLVRVPLRPDPVVCVTHARHPAARSGRTSIAALADHVLAVNAWGDGVDVFLRLLADHVDDWRVRFCGDATTALTLARDHGHVAFVTDSARAGYGSSEQLRKVTITNTRGWTVRLDLLHRQADRNDPAILAITRTATKSA